MAAPSGTNVTLEHGDYRATVVEVGAGLRTLTRAGLDLVASYPEGEICSGGRGQLLLPWPNRIDGGRYRFEGRDHQLPLSEPARANAIHGLTRWVGWRLLDSSSSSATWGYRLHPQPGYPGDLELTVDYLLADTGLRVAVSALNLGSGPAPYGAGAHPYLTVGRQLDECELLLPAAIRTSSDARGLPGPAEPVDRHDVDFRSARRIGAAVLDDAFGVLTYDGDVATARLRDPETGRSATLWADRAFRWLQVFSGDTLPSGARESLAVEPMTCPPNAFVSTVDLVVLQPGESHRAVFGIS